jgi:hypothetical protein
MQFSELLNDRRKEVQFLFAELEDLHVGLLGPPRAPGIRIQEYYI